MNKCIDCQTEIENKSKRCQPCYLLTIKGINHPNYKHGNRTNNKICKNCGIEISCSATFCRSCATTIQLQDPTRNPNWKGGVIYERGYRLIFIPEYNTNTSCSYEYEHRLIMEKHLGRKLKSTEIIHHINGIRDDNRIENLMLFKSNSEHRDFHANLFTFIAKHYFNIILEYMEFWNKKGEKHEQNLCS